jgi:hypothetical protein
VHTDTSHIVEAPLQTPNVRISRITVYRGVEQE